MATNDLEVFFLAARIGYIPLLKHYIENGIDIHSYNDFALRLAVENGRKQAVIFLLKNGASTQVLDNSVLRYASLHGNVKTVQELLEKGTCDEESKLYAMYNGILHGYPDIVKLLLEDGLSPTDNDGAILRVVKMCKHKNVVDLFKDYFN